MARLSVRVLGPLQVRVDGEPASGFVSDKVRALLVYLALSSHRPHRREALAGLLWPEFSQRSARNSLRNTLANLRKTIGDAEARPPFLHNTRQTIQFNEQSDYWLDADVFERLVATVPPAGEELEQAIRLVRGSFLEGFSLADAAPFEEWLLLRRERFDRQVVEALEGLVTLYEGHGEYEHALAHARRRVELDPWQERGQRQLMRLLVQSGHRNEALACYKALCRSLCEELGAEPSEETKALYEAILGGALAAGPAVQPGPPVPIWNLPAPTTPFFGRVDELATLKTKLAKPSTRLVTLTGLGGSGKTRLALEAGSRLVEEERQALRDNAPLTFAHGVVFVPLAKLDSVEGLASVLADALHLRLEEGEEQLLEFLRPKQVLLILDNLEQLLDGVEFLAEMMRVAPGVKILATSRERLGIQGEHVLSLGGLPCPDQDLEVPWPEGPDLDDWLATYPALQLLVEGIRRVRSAANLSDRDLLAMVGICRLADGLPLALNMAASWADVLSLEDVLSGARQSLGFLRVDWPDLPERQRSICALFDTSWRRLSLAEQTTFSSLTVFCAGFTREAAAQVMAGTEANPRLLAALVRKSFMQYNQEQDRYQIHELLRQYGAEKLAQNPARKAEVCARHSEVYAAALQRWHTDLVGSREQAALNQMEAESENIRAAWTWAVEQGQVELLGRGMEGLECFYRKTGRYRQAEAAFGAAADAAASAARRERSDRASCLRVCVRALAWQSNHQRTIGQPGTARRTQQRALRTLENPGLIGVDTRLERAILAYCIGSSTMSVDYEQARRQFKESSALFRDLDLQWGMARALTAWGNTCAILGWHGKARRRLEEGLAISRALGNRSCVSMALGFLAYLARMEGRFEEAMTLARQAYAEWLDQGARRPAGLNHMFLSTALEHQGRFSEAEAVLKEGQALQTELGNRLRYTQVHSALVRVTLHRGRYEEARDAGVAGLALARECGPRFCIGLNHLLLGCLDLAEGASAEAIQHLQDGISVYEDYGPTDDLGWGFALLALAALGLGDAAEAKHYLCRAFQLALDVRAIPPLLWALPPAALLLAKQGEPERAVALYALASRHPFVANSRWFEDVAGRQIAVVAGTLPAERVEAAGRWGRERDVASTAAELLAELGG